MAINDPLYLLRRMIASCDAAKLAQHPAAREAHRTLAKLYHEQWQAALTEAAVPPAPITFRPTLESEMARV